MLHDCDSAFQWVADNIEQYGGDPANVVIVGQSAGAHISSLCLFAQVRNALPRQVIQTLISRTEVVVQQDMICNSLMLTFRHLHACHVKSQHGDYTI